MKVIYKEDKEHLPYILYSAIWFYLQHTDELLNKTKDQELIDHYVKIQRIIKEKMLEGVKKPKAGEKFEIFCDNSDMAELLTEILHYYLEETNEVLRTIEDPEITKRCLKDMESIKNELLKGIAI